MQLYTHEFGYNALLLWDMTARVLPVKIQAYDTGPQLERRGILVGPTDTYWYKTALLGKGGQGTIHEIIGHDLVIKIPKHSGRLNPMRERQANRERILCQSLPLHPNILPVVGEAIIDDRICFVSPRMECDAKSYVKRCPHVDPILLILGALRGLACLHESGMAHGDVKGKNLLVDRDGYGVLSDFGSLHRLGDTLGHARTDGFAAPETYGWGYAYVCSMKADMWSFGCLILELYGGRNPGSQARGYRAPFNVRHIEYARARGMPSGVENLARRSLNPDPRARPTADEALRILEWSLFGLWRSANGEMFDRLHHHVPHCRREDRFAPQPWL